MAKWTRRSGLSLLFVAMSMTVACGDDDDDGGTEADKIGIGASCDSADDCLEGQSCLAFKGGYCGLQNCTGDEVLGCNDPDPAKCCPDGSKCVTHTDGVNYCFRECLDKELDCNRNRPADAESNCSSNITFVAPEQGIKACVPPSS